MTSNDIVAKLEQYKILKESVNKTLDHLLKVNEASSNLVKDLNNNYMVNDMPSLTTEKSKDLQSSISSTINYLRTVVIPAIDEVIDSLQGKQTVN